MSDLRLKPMGMLLVAMLVLFVPQTGLGHGQPCSGPHANDDGCGGGGGDPVLYSVTVIAGENALNYVESGEGCEGVTDSKSLSASWIPLVGCGPVTVATEGLDPLDLYLFTIEVKKTKKQETVRFYFSGEHEGESHPETGSYVTDFFLVDIPEDRENGFDIELLNLVNESLIKLGQPDKGSLVGTVSFGTIVYVPQ